MQPLAHDRPDAPWQSRAITATVVISLFLHLFACSTLWFLSWRFPSLFASDSGNDGENGVRGSGGEMVDIEVPGAPDPEHEATPAQATPEAPAAAHQTPPTAEAVPTPAVAPEDDTTETTPVPAAPNRHTTQDLANAHPTPTPREPPTPEASTRPVPESPTSSTPAIGHGGREQPHIGTGAFAVSRGLRPGSIGSQRSLLPRAQACGDPVAGTWRAQTYDPLVGDWMLATLVIHHQPDDRLEGTITAHVWDGGPVDVHAPPCGPDGYEAIVDMPGHGSLHGGFVDFGAHVFHTRAVLCNQDVRRVTYNPDHFTGVIDTRLQEFQSVNNDGGRAVNEPMVFRRIRCLPGDDLLIVDPNASPPAE